MATRKNKKPRKKTTPKKRPSRAQRNAQQLAELRTVTQSMMAHGQGAQAIETLLQVIDTMQQDHDRMLMRVAASIRARFGRKSEKLSAEELGQLVLALGGTEEEADAATPMVPHPPTPVEQGDAAPEKKPTKHRGRSRLSPDLPRVVTVVKVPEDERKCIHCGVDMVCIHHVDHETVEYIPGRIEVHVERREKVACKACEQDIATAPRVQPAHRFERRAGASLLAHLVESKCDDALPVYRQHDQLQRLGFQVPLNTLYGYWDHATTLLTPLAEVILSRVLGDFVVGVDDTRLDYLDPEGPRTKQRGHLWCFVGTGPYVAFTFTETWAAEDIEPWLSAIDHFVQCDDYKGYSAIIRDDLGERVLVPPSKRLGCMMHVRRKFHAAYKGGHLGAALPLRLIADIYKIEDEAKSRGLEFGQRHQLRHHKALPLLTQFDQWVDVHLPQLNPKSPLATAANYAQQQRAFIHRCFDDGRFEIDNGRVERQIREPAIGRKNFLFSGSAHGAQRLAAAYTIVLSARRAGLHVREYLIDVIDKLQAGWPARRIAELTPLRWKTSHTMAQKTA